MKSVLLPTTVVGSYPQPVWLIDRDALGAKVPRIRAPELWRVSADQLQQSQDEGVRLAVGDMEAAGIDIVTDGEIRRESYSNYFATTLDGIDGERPGSIATRSGQQAAVPRVVGPVSRPRPVGTRDITFLRSVTTKTIKATVPGPFTMSQQAQDDYYGDARALALDLADAVNLELRELVAAGADIVQLDEPWVTARPEQAREFAIEAIDRALDGIEAVTALHLCLGYAAAVRSKPSAYPYLAELEGCTVQQISIEAAEARLDLSVLEQFPTKTMIVGVLDLADPDVDSVESIVERTRAALEWIDPERLVLAPDCGMKYLPRQTAFGKLTALAEAARVVRSEFGE
ncbi:MAG TPA: uroporphyrinogen decarboxylase family protein [Solirubrobacteraceae bacterium]|jgi:5-methyltetrahydropteroyltriglutamate--homocysteine methyltransferase